jgi:hypothetical protein
LPQRNVSRETFYGIAREPNALFGPSSLIRYQFSRADNCTDQLSVIANIVRDSSARQPDAPSGLNVSRETLPPDQRANTCFFGRSRRDIDATLQVMASISITTNCYRQSENVSRETFPPKSATEQSQNLESRAESAR